MADRQAWLAGALYAAGVALFAVNLWGDRYFFHDDAFIALRYARNLLEHGDLSWNIGDRVEGYTNFLHLIAAAGLMRLGLTGPLAAQAVNAVGAAALVGAAVAGTRQLAPGVPVARAAGVALVLSASTLAAWLLGGLEAVPAAALLGWGLVALLPLFEAEPPGRHRRAAAAGIAFALSYLVRPDALLTAAVAGVAVLAFGRAPPRRRIIDFVIVGAIPAVVLAVHVGWRLAYYDAWLPNTFEAKVGVPAELRLALVARYVVAGTLIYMPAIGLALIATAWLAAKRRLSRPAILLAFCAVTHAAYVVWSGGDHMPAARLLLPLLLPAALLVTLAIAHAPRQAAPAAGAVALAAVAAVAGGHRRADEAVYIGRVIAPYIERHWPAGSLVALHTAGSIPYLAPGNIYIDMLGLNDRHIARRPDVPMLAPYQINPGHAKGDGVYVLGRKPDYIIAGPAEGRPVDVPWFLSDAELSLLPEFRRCYVMRQVELPYDVPAAARRDKIPNPLVFTWYERSC